MKRFLIAALLASALGNAQTSDYSGGFAELYFGRQPSARSEAMGRAQTAVGGEVFASYYNPAATATLKSPSFGMSQAEPFYADHQGRLDFYGLVVPLGVVGTIGMSRTQYLRSPLKGRIMDPLKHQLLMYTLNYSRALYRGLRLGVNVQWFRRNFVHDLIEHHDKAMVFDAGLFHQFSPKPDQHISLGLSITNLNKASADSEAAPDDAFPAVLRAGGAYERGLMPGLTMLLTAEAQDVLNGDFQSAFRVGSEWTLFETLKVRLGYYQEKLQGDGAANQKAHIRALTYGLGVHVVLQDWFEEAPDWVLRLDVARMPQPNIATYDIHWGAFTVYGIGIEFQ